MNGIRLGLLMSLVCKASWRGMSAARRICLLTKLTIEMPVQLNNSIQFN